MLVYMLQAKKQKVVYIPKIQQSSKEGKALANRTGGGKGRKKT